MLAWNQIALLLAPPLLDASTYAVYQLLERRSGKKWSYLGGFLFYWTLWCLLFPLALLGPQRLLGLFRGVSSPFGHPWWFGAFCLLGPPLVAFIFLFPGVLRKASVRLALVVGEPHRPASDWMSVSTGCPSRLGPGDEAGEVRLNPPAFPYHRSTTRRAQGILHGLQ